MIFLVINIIVLGLIILAEIQHVDFKKSQREIRAKRMKDLGL